MCNADDERHLFLTDECLSIDQGIKVPKLEDYFLRRRGLTSEYTSRTRALELYPELDILGLPELDAEDSFLSNILQSSLYDFFHKISFPLSEGKRIASSGGKREGDKLVSKKDTISHHSYSIVSPLIIIARNLRSKHAVYLNHEKNEICLSSNFYGASFDRTGYPRRHPGGSFPAKPPISDNHVKFITAYLNSVFGELSVVMQCSDREGTRKLDSYLQAENISFLNPSILLSNEVDRVIDLFQAYSDTLDFGIISKNSEGDKFWHPPPNRIELDKAISELVFKYHNPTDFDSANELLDFVVSQCESITNSRQT
jgi:hypothetical protein